MLQFDRDWQAGGSPKTPFEVMDFVAKRVKSKEFTKLDHNIDCIGALVGSLPFILHYSDKSEDIAAKVMLQFYLLEATAL